MAVPKERLLGRLKAYLTSKAINLSNARIDESSLRLCSLPADDADDAAIDAVIANADVIFPFKEIATGDDRLRTLEAQTKKPETKTPEQLAAEEKAKADAEALAAAQKADTPAWALALIEANKKLEDKLTVIETGKLTDVKKSAAQQAFEKSEVFKALKTPEDKEFWLNQINVDSETPTEDQLKGLETRYTGMQQSIAESLGYSGGIPATGSTATPKADATTVTAILDNMKF